MTKKQWEMTIDIIKTLGLAAVIGSVGDGVLSGGRPWIDAVGVTAGVVGLGVTIWLTKKLNGDKL